MAGGGYYPIMTDAEWARAPWNEPEPRECPFCEGEGTVFLNGDEVKCRECDGEGFLYD